MWSVRFGTVQRIFLFWKVIVVKQKLSVLCVTVNLDLKNTSRPDRALFSVLLPLPGIDANDVIRSVRCVKASQVSGMQLKSQSCKT